MSGPRLSIVADCTGCKHLGKTFERVRSSGEYVCGYGPPVWPNLANSTRTPDNCPLLPAAAAAFLEEARKA